MAKYVRKTIGEEKACFGTSCWSRSPNNNQSNRRSDRIFTIMKLIFSQYLVLNKINLIALEL